MSESKKELIEEHRRLVRILKEGTAKDRLEEYERQLKELKKLLAGGEYEPANEEMDKAERNGNGSNQTILVGTFETKGAEGSLKFKRAFQKKNGGWVHAGQPEAAPRPLKHVLADVIDGPDVRLISHELKKSNYGPKGAGLYDPTANINRKATRTGEEVPDAGKNVAVRQYTSATMGTAKQQADTLANKQKALNRRQPVKTLKDLSPEDKAELEAKYNVKKAEMIAKAEAKLTLLRTAIEKAIAEEKLRKGESYQPSDYEFFYQFVGSSDSAPQWDGTHTIDCHVTDEQVAAAVVEDPEG